MVQNGFNTGSEPSSRSIARRIIDDARSRGLGPGDMLPSVRVLAREYDVGRAVVEQAFKYLANEALCYPVHGKGTFLAQEPPEFSGESTTVSVVLNYLEYREEEHPFYRRLYEGVAEQAIVNDHNILSLHNWHRKTAFQKNGELNQFSKSLVGHLALAIYDDDDCLRLRDTGIPAVAIDYDTEALGMDCVVMDNRGVMTDLVARVLEENPERVFLAALSRSTDYDPAIVERREAFQALLLSRGRKISPDDFIYVGENENVQENLKPLVGALGGNDATTAVVCMDDSVAQDINGELEANGVDPGQDFVLAYIGFLYPQYRSLESVPAFVGAVDFRELGREGVRLLEERVEKGPGRAVCRRIPGTVIERCNKTGRRSNS